VEEKSRRSPEQKAVSICISGDVSSDISSFYQSQVILQVSNHASVREILSCIFTCIEII